MSLSLGVSSKMTLFQSSDGSTQDAGECVLQPALDASQPLWGLTNDCLSLPDGAASGGAASSVADGPPSSLSLSFCFLAILFFCSCALVFGGLKNVTVARPHGQVGKSLRVERL